jgi:hypothetical protein
MVPMKTPAAYQGLMKIGKSIMTQTAVDLSHILQLGSTLLTVLDQESMIVIALPA